MLFNVEKCNMLMDLGGKNVVGVYATCMNGRDLGDKGGMCSV
jgi:hypothetical protein